MTEFSHIQSIQTLESSADKSKGQLAGQRGVLQLRVAGSSELLVSCMNVLSARGRL